ncbi:MAG: 30S ribosome-binding factor RbfA [Lentisphaeria bacterium]|jgi:ribosome-binding factor A|nr:30S ribosome-binding factor RbfA [Lentisphaeria bacterium]
MSADRLLRVNELLKRELGIVFTVLISPASPTLVTVTGVKTAPNLRDATVYVSVYGSEEQGQAALALLNAKRAHIQSEVARKVVLKYTPRLHFRLDRTAANADRVLSILNNLELEGDAAPAPDDAGPVQGA